MNGVNANTGMNKNVDTVNDGVYSFHVILLSDSEDIHHLWLPKTPEGFFRFSDQPDCRFISICARNGKWVAMCRKPAFFRNVPIDQSCEIELSDGLMVQVELDERIYSLYTERVSSDHMVFHNYYVDSDQEITIGSHPGCDICYDNPLVSRTHAVLCRRQGQWHIEEHGSLCSVYINGKKSSSCILKLGDTIHIIGLRIVIGVGFLSVAESTGKVSINPKNLRNMLEAQGGYSRYYSEEVLTAGQEIFNRAPRKRFEQKLEPIIVEAPPMSMDQKQIPMLLRMGSSMVMGGTAALAGNYTTLISSVLFPFLTSKFTEKQRQEYEELRNSKYTEYLEEKEKEITNACQEEQTFLNQKYPTVQRVLKMVEERTHLWERRPADNDFLQIRLGTGTQPLTTPIEYPKRHFELMPDELTEKMYQLVETPRLVPDVPIIMPLLETNVCGIQGQRKLVLDYIYQTALQIAGLHSYDEVKMVFLLKEEELKELDALRYLPHTWDDKRSVRLIATNEAEAYFVGDYIKEQILEVQEKEKDIRKVLKKRPYHVIFSLEKKLMDCHEGFKEILQSDENLGVSIISAHENLPKEVQLLLTLDENGHNVCTTMRADGGEDVSFSIDPYEVKDAEKAMATMANTLLRNVTQEHELPKMVTFLEMLKTGRVEQLNPLKRWKESNPVKSLAAPVGVGADGSLFMLDLHEKRQGPHGLVAGMTGSGKSEFIITYILSMAVNYHPDEVAFVLIDYKGGGLAGAFENPKTGVKLPHLVGTITNLDGASIQRSLLSIESELLRRQKKFNEVKSIVNEGTIDIYTYQKLYRAGKVSEPMPHLLIISDEFAELKQQQPEFMAKLISAARIGRSLGVHLILATQKPSGVVDDQIRSNTKFRVCLRVQERSDSMDMLKRPEAAELTDTGRFYLQVGYNEYFAMGQSAWCGAQYEPQDTVAVRRDDTLEVLDTTGQVVAKASPKVRKVDSGKKQIVAIVEYLSELAKRENINPKQLWEPELPKRLDLEKLQEKHRSTDNPMSVAVGLVDDPENMRQFPYVLNFETCGNLLITGESGSGKTTLVQNILYLLSKQLPPEDFNFYALDYSSRMLKLFKPLPHCGAILHEEDMGSLDEFFKLVNSLVAERKKLFSELEVDSFEAAKSIKKIPLILVAIDNIAGLSTSRPGEQHYYRLQDYLKNSASYGVKYIVTCGHMNEISSKIRQELTERICMHMQDRYVYNEILGCKVSYIPAQVVGRGLVNWEDNPLEFQSAAVYPTDESVRIKHIKEIVKRICQQHESRAEAQRLFVAKDDIEYEEFVSQFKRGRLPLGYSKSGSKPIALPMRQLSVLSVYFGNKLSKLPVLRNILYAAQREQMELWIIQRNENSIFQLKSTDPEHIGQLENADYLTCTVDNIRLLQQALVAVAEQRKAMLEEYYEQEKIDPNREDISSLDAKFLQEKVTPILVVIESIADFCRLLSNLATLSYCKLFKYLHYYNVYIVGCLEPDAPEEASKNNLFTQFTHHDMLLFGGNFDHQKLYPISGSAQIGEMPFNVALMVYRNEIHALTMPCGKIEETQVDEDLQSIF